MGSYKPEEKENFNRAFMVEPHFGKLKLDLRPLRWVVGDQCFCPSSNDLEQAASFWSGSLGLIGFRLCCLTLMVQAAVLDGFHFDASPFGQNGFTSTEVDICWR